MAANTVGEIWHKRLCHMSEKGMQKLAIDDLIPEVKNVLGTRPSMRKQEQHSV